MDVHGIEGRLVRVYLSLRQTVNKTKHMPADECMHGDEKLFYLV